jgi:glycosyltransferase involved in cell wall biosynthesis
MVPLFSLCRPSESVPMTRSPMLSFIVPAHNEELWIGKCLGSIRAAMERVNEPHEVIVVDDASTDSTQQIARQSGAHTLRVEYRKISAVRNAGARAARGDVFFFVDADTQINERAVGAALAALRAGAVGGGCLFDFDGPESLWARITLFMAGKAARVIRWACGCFLFCTREACTAAGGFSESLYAGEDLAFVQALKKVGRFVVLKPKVVSSGRKLDVVRPWEVLGLMFWIAIRGPHYESKWIRDILYGRRDHVPMGSLAEKPLTGKPDAGIPPVRFGGRGGAKAPSLPLSRVRRFTSAAASFVESAGAPR